MGPVQNFEQHSRHLVEQDLPIHTRLQMAMEVRDSLEIAHTAEYLNFLKCYFRAFSVILLQVTKPQFVDNPEHKLRNIVVEILNRLPHSEVLRPFVQDLLKVAMQVLTTDNEENGLICIRIIFDLLRNFRPTLENEVQPFLDFVCKIYQNFRLTVSHFFESSAAMTGVEDVKPMDSSSLDQSISPAGYTGTGQLNPSTRSFKIVTESPLVVMFLFQLYGRLVQTNIPHLLPLMVAAISVPGPEKVPPHLKTHFIELKGAQVKTVSFLTYLLKSFADYIRPHEESICKSIVNLLVTCSDSVSIRKELLVALKHVLGTDFKRGLFPLIDTLLEERVLVGTGRACFESLRPLAYSLLAEIVHHVRGDLSLAQLSRIIYLFSSNMHDASLSLNIHTTCARLMLNLVESIFEKGIDQQSMDEARILLGRILDAFVGKFSTFKHTIPQLLDEGEEGKDRATMRSKLELPVQAVLNLQVPVEHSKEVSDCKNLIKTLVMGMKTIIWSITHAHLPRSQVSPSSHGTHSQMLVSPNSTLPASQAFKGMREDEVWKASGVLKSGVHCLALFKDKEEEKEMLGLFSQILAIMEPRDLMDMFSLCMPELFECMISNNQLVHIFSSLLQASKVYRAFADVLVNFLVSSKLDVLKHPDSPAAKLVLHLFRFIFGAVAKAPADFERILLPHVPVIMEVCMKNASEIEKPLGYVQLLRTMFRALIGCKFELLLRELIPMLQPCLNMLLTMLEGPTGEDMRDLLLELCLTLPARLSSLLPYLPRLMRPLVLCLKGTDDLVSLGLRTLEFWVDSLNPDFLEPNMANVMSEVILALWSHLRPAPYPWGGKALQVLGKLGGRNRRFLKEPLALDCKENPEHGLRLILTFEPSTPFLVPLDRCINLAVAAVMHKSSGMDAFYRKQALKFLRVCLSSQLNLPGNISDEGFTPRQLSTLLHSTVDSSLRRSETSDIKADLGVKTKTQLMAEKSVFKILLMTVIAANAEPDLVDSNEDFVMNVCRHFAIIFHIDSTSTNASSTSATLGGPILSSNGNLHGRLKSSTSSNLKELDPLIFLDALVDVLADVNRLHAKSALNALNVFAETLLFLARSKHSDLLMPRGGPGTPMIVSSPSMNPVYSPPPSVRIPVFEQLLPRLLHCCYGSAWQAQMGGVMGLGALVGKVTVETLCAFQVKIVRGLIYVLKRLPLYASKEQEETSQVLTQVLRVVNNVDEANSESRRQSFQGVVEFLALELFNSNASIIVRKTVQSCLALLASRTGSEVSELLEPLYQPLLQPLIVRPLRSKTVDQQVGTVTALNFCLALRPPLLRLTQELVNFLQEALQIAEADETVWVVKFMNPKVATSLNKLRTACIELLCTTMAWADFRTPNHSELRAKIISMFFKSLTCRTPEIVAVAKEGLRQVINQQRMPKELLQSSLRPILVNLASTKNLSMPLLQGLARLLELLSTWFNVTLGGKLLEHLKKWLEPEKLAQSQKSWKSGEEPKIAAAIIELFHLLPQAASKFLDDLVTLTIDLEGALPPGQVYSEINSPYRLPLTKFLNRYAMLAVDYFLARLSDPKYFRRFMYIIQSDAGQPLRDELSRSPQKILATAFPEFLSQQGTNMGDNGLINRPSDSSNVSFFPTGETTDAYFHGLALTKTLVKLIPGWLHSNRLVFDTLVLVWKSSARITRLNSEQELNLIQIKESKWLVKCFLNYLRHDKEEVDVLFDILSIFLFHSRIDYTFLKEFYIIEVAEGYSSSLKKSLLLHFLNLFQSKQLGHDHLVVVMQMLILPMLAHAFQNDQSWDVVDHGIIKTIVEKLLDPPEEVSAEYDEPLRIELLQLATLLLKYLQNDLVHHRKELIKFGWNHLKREDSASKQWAFVNVCHFLEAYQAPEKIILQVFVALLRTCQPENKMLVKQALDILMPALPKRLPVEARMPIWIRYTKKILVEEGHSIPNLIHIFQLIVRHSDLFYSCRAQFVPQMVNSLNRLGLPYNTTAENRRLAIELAGLVVGWERQRRNEMKVVTEGDDAPGQLTDGFNPGPASTDAKRHMDGSTFPEDPSKKVKVEPGLQSLCVMSPGGASSIPNIETPGSTGQPDEEFKPNAAMEEMVINFLIRVALVIEPKDKEASTMYKQASELLSQALEVWPNANVKFNYLEKLLSSLQPSQSKDPSTALAQGLDVMNKVLEKQPHLFIRNNINQISQILEPCFKYKVLDAGKSLCSLLKMVFVAFPLEGVSTPPDVKLLYQKVDELIQKHINTVTAPQASTEDNSGNSISFVLLVIKTLAEVHKNVDPYTLVRFLQRLARDMGSSGGSHLKQGQRTDPDSSVTSSRLGADAGVVISNLKSVLKLISEGVMLVSDCKRSVTQILNTLLSEKGTDAGVLLCILDVIRGWIEADICKSGTPTTASTFLSPKEIVSFLQKLSQVDKQNFSPNAVEEWDMKYLELLYGLCGHSDKYPLALRQEVFLKVERQFMLGLRARDPEVRKKFFSLYHESLGKTLFIRLQYIIQIQDWEALSDVFWLKQGLDLLLAVLVGDKPITLAPNSARVLPLVAAATGSLPDSSGMQHQIADVPEGLEEAPLTFDSLVLKHAQFMNEMSKLQVDDLVIPLRELAHTDANVAYHLWVLVFPIVWVTLHKDEQVTLAKPMISLLSKDYHKKQQGNRPNVVQALLEGLQLSHPQPRMPSELIKYIGKTYNAWHIALALLESHVMLFMNETKCCESLAELYRLLNEEDMRCGLWKKKSVTAETRAGLSLVQHGYWQRAQSLFYQAMVKATQGTYNNTVPKAEMCLWEEQWIYCATQLSQWDALVDFGKSIENYEILLDTLWKLPDWAYMKEHVIPKAQVEETPKLRLIQSFFALHDRNANGVGDAENIVGKGVDLTLEQWWQLPEMSVHSRIPLLQQFQQLVEVQESARILVDISNGNKLSGNAAVGVNGNLYADLKDILETWRLRTPNKWDNMSVWYDLLQWRNEMYNAVIDAFKDFSNTNAQLHHLGYRDKAWNVNKLAHIARKQGLYDVCVTILEKMYGHSTMEVQEAFVKIREQANAYLEMKGELTSGLNLINSTNLEYFPGKHKAEIFRIKGDFLLKLNDSEGANVAYSNAITLFKNLPKAWISWGNYCDMAYKETHDEIWLEYAVCCFLQGIKFGVSNSRNHIARVLYLLSFDTPNECVGRAFDKYLDQIPHWVWLSWVPQLLLSLQRSEASHCKLVLLKIATVYPQALYYWLRTYLLERRDVANKSELGRMAMAQQRMQQNVSGSGAGSLGLSDGNARAPVHGGGALTSENQVHQGSQSGSGVGSHDGGNSHVQEADRSTVMENSMHAGNDQPSQQSTPSVNEGGQNVRRNGALGLVASAASAFDAAKDIMEALRSKHTNLAGELESLLTEIGSRFVTLPEERLLAVVNALLHRCYKYPTATTAEVPQSLKKELSGVCRACFSADAVNKHVDFVRDYKQDFERDLDPESTATFPSTLSELTERLKHWKNVLQSNVEDRFPAVLKLEEESRVLRDFHVVDVEVPGQYFSDQEITPDHTVKLDRIGADIPIVRRHGSSFRRLTLIGSDGSQRHFIVQTSLTPNARSDERILQLFRVMNQMFDKHKESRRRHICIHTPIIIPVWSQVRMVEDDVMYNTLLEVYENHCARNDREADLPITYFKEQLNQAISGQITPEAVVDLRLQAYNDITKNLVTDNIFSQYMYKTLLSGNHMWAFKKQFAIQLALTSFMSFMLQIGGRSPNKILFAKNTGKIFQTDFHPAYDANGMIEFNEPVPFRMTRNMQAFFSHFGVEGLIVSAMCAAAQAVVSPKQSQHLWYQLAMFFRDELLSWSWRRPLGMALAPVPGGGSMSPIDFKNKVTTNVDHVIGRISRVAPQYFSEEEENAVDPPQAVQKGVADLVEAALSPRNLCMMDPTWHPWF
ncbi:Phosphatidylinositol 3- and 4-kinase family protein with FAT domain isoform 1 [Tripterygium wilfordii]|uniref:Phosphatidylinositol 3- and 4-kinase family protein with FAT domain isoform 1 n=1 Tax=Tripterygium wilfordii TaxID=458696 RepID=A0A7J7CPD4_TRIWF|nr:transcription-associated protein 1-like isoform X2 [Tripterygium wilfordii]KAF5735955.1 Phosphatidylinositol 3- and 4-kinase family protein with FAT domain isoform 1 [Tripterygium wilfordii]